MNRRAALAAFAGAWVACRAHPKVEPGIRVVSIAPSATEIVFAIGAGSLLVGRSRFCDYPPEALSLPIVGGFSDPSVEAILALRPTLVVGARGPAGPALEETLRAHGIKTYFPEVESVAQIESMIREIGMRLAHETAAAQAIIAIEEKRAEVLTEARARPRVRAALLFDIAPIVVAGPGSFPDELLRIAGADNVIIEGGLYPTVPIERLIALDPDVLLDGSVQAGHEKGGSRLLAQRQAPGFRELAALRAGKVRAVAASEALRPGPRIGDGLVLIARAIEDASSPSP